MPHTQSRKDVWKKLPALVQAWGIPIGVMLIGISAAMAVGHGGCNVHRLGQPVHEWTYSWEKVSGFGHDSTRPRGVHPADVVWDPQNTGDLIVTIYDEKTGKWFDRFRLRRAEDGKYYDDVQDVVSGGPPTRAWYVFASPGKAFGHHRDEAGEARITLERRQFQ